MMFLGLIGEIMKDRTMKIILEFILSLQCFVPLWKHLQPSKLGGYFDLYAIQAPPLLGFGAPPEIDFFRCFR